MVFLSYKNHVLFQLKYIFKVSCVKLNIDVWAIIEDSVVLAYLHIVMGVVHGENTQDYTNIGGDNQ